MGRVVEGVEEAYGKEDVEATGGGGMNEAGELRADEALGGEGERWTCGEEIAMKGVVIDGEGATPVFN